MIGKIEKMIKDMEHGVYDFTKDGKCSQCGQCCANFLPMSEKELKRIKLYVKKHHIKPQKHILPTADAAIDFTCPLRNDAEKKCMCYEVRPPPRMIYGQQSVSFMRNIVWWI